MTKPYLWVLPTTLTVLRLALLPVVVISLFLGAADIAFGVFLFAEATDILDGWAARRLSVSSELGALLDTLADKIFHLPLLFYYLIWPRPDLPHFVLLRDLVAQYASWLIFAVIAGIELLLILSRTSLLDRWRTAASNKAGLFGKIKTWVQAMAIGCYIVGNVWTVSAAQALVAVAMVFGFLSLSSRIRLIRSVR